MKQMPVIAILTGVTKRDGSRFATLNMDYANAVSASGGAPILIAPSDPVQAYAETILRLADGILFSGGGDIEPSLFNQLRSDKCNEPDLARDHFEIALCANAFARDIPVLGICRGLQIMCVAAGGALYQHIEGHGYYDKPGAEVQTVSIEPHSLLSRVAGSEDLAVNSRHHQAVFGETTQLKAVAFCTEDLHIEAMEHRTNRFALGVQWHPETMAAGFERHKRIFTAFVNACKR